MRDFFETLRVQRWDDHRYYHHSRINQSLHFLSALSFIAAYGMLFIDPPIAAVIAWMISMTSRQAGHFFFEPKTYDRVNQASHEYKEEIKVGYNLKRKVVLMAIWVLSPFALLLDPTLFGALKAHTTVYEFVRNTGWIWLAVGVGGLVFRTVHLFFLQGIGAGLAWMTKILTDPFHDALIYYKAPYYLLKGQLIDPMDDVVAANTRPQT